MFCGYPSHFSQDCPLCGWSDLCRLSTFRENSKHLDDLSYCGLINTQVFGNAFVIVPISAVQCWTVTILKAFYNWLVNDDKSFIVGSFFKTLIGLI